MKNKILEEQLTSYIVYLEQEERSCATRNQYRRDISYFLAFWGEEELAKETLLNYKERLEEKYQPASVNAKLVALNGFFTFIGRRDLHLKLLKIQNKAYCSADKLLTKAEYMRLVQAAEKRQNKRLSLLLQTICSTGIRVSELQFITAEAVAKGEAVVKMKGKTRTILIPGKLRKALKGYLRREGIVAGAVFVTKTGRPLDRSNIWKMMKSLWIKVIG